MAKLQRIGVESHSFYFGILRVIQIISQKGRSQILHVDPYLVGAACFQGKADKRTVLFGTESLVMSYGFFTMLKVYAAEDSRIFFSGNGSSYSESLLHIRRDDSGG